MKKKFLKVALICAIISSMGMSSCIGSFALFNKLLAWNNTIGDKFVNELVFFAFWVLPVYPVASVADFLVLNSIEFWSGESPLAHNKTVVDGKDGKYLVENDNNGYTITSLNDNTKVRLNFDQANQTWSYVNGDGKEYPLMTFVDDTHVMVPNAEGEMMLVEKSQHGLYAYQQTVMCTTLFASR